jgi:hypothetical protein
VDRVNINSNQTTTRQKKSVILGVLGLALVLLGGKFALDIYYSSQVTIDLNGKPALLFITDDHPCECAKKLIAEAEFQIEHWVAPDRMQVQLIQVYFGDQRGLERKYKIFRTPSLILLDSRGQIVHRQDYPLIGGKPFDLQEFESKMETQVNYLQ